MNIVGEEGIYRVFFSRITLEDKLGQEYEPYIFAALHSAKIMLAVGTDYEYYNAVWVKNEWSRYLKLIAAGEKKVLIPCYKGIDAYDMPKEFARLQAQDLGKVGAMQDLLRGIEKIIGSKQKDDISAQVKVAAAAANPTVDSYLMRVQLFLEEKNWERAEEYCEKVLDIDPQNGRAYIDKFLISLKISSIEQLSSIGKPFDGNSEYMKALRFANDDDKKRIEEANQIIKTRIAAIEEAEIIAAENAVAATKAAVMTRNKNMKRARIILGMEPDSETTKRIKDEDIRFAEEIRRLEAELAAEKDKETRLLQAVEREKNEMCAAENARFNTQITLFENKEKELKNEYAKLGLFAGARKKEINAELESMSEKIIKERETHKANLLLIEDETAAKCQDICKQSAPIELRIEEESKRHDTLRTELKRSFGRYPDTLDGELKPIEWHILDATDSAALIISRFIIDSQKYNEEKVDITWKTCSLRKWLNDTFLHSAFNEEEQTRILNIKEAVNNNSQPQSVIDSGNEMLDKVFLLSVDEANKFLGSSRVKGRCRPTAYAKGGLDNGDCSYWLRSQGNLGI